MRRRTYYDHEPAYRQRAEAGHTGWSNDPNDAAFDAFHQFLESSHFPQTPGVALDLGCGAAETSVDLAQHGWQVIGIEYAETALRLARANITDAPNPITLVRADLTAPWPVASEAFDLIIDNHALHCLIEPHHRRNFLTEARRALKSGGTFFCATMTGEGSLDRTALHIQPDHINADRNRIWQPLDFLKQEFTGAGFNLGHTELLDDPNDPKFGQEAIIVAG